VSKNILYIIQKDSLSEEAIQILESSHIEFQTVIIDLDGTGKFMWRDTRTLEVPVLLNDNRLYSGLEAISDFAHMYLS
jgi:hypothetical protein